MKHLKLYEAYLGTDIETLCKKYLIKNYTITDDGIVNVDGSVDLSIYKLTELPLRFGKVTGDFTCNDNNLTSLKGCPYYVGRSFHCYNNKLTNLDYAPKYVGTEFLCTGNRLTSLDGVPENITALACNYNPIFRWYKEVGFKKLEIFLYMNIDTNDPDEINQEKIDYILNN